MNRVEKVASVFTCFAQDRIPTEQCLSSAQNPANDGSQLPQHDLLNTPLASTPESMTCRRCAKAGQDSSYHTIDRLHVDYLHEYADDITKSEQWRREISQLKNECDDVPER
jgi:hypothetical protein